MSDLAQKVADEGSGSVEMLEQLIELTEENKEEIFANPESVLEHTFGTCYNTIPLCLNNTIKGTLFIRRWNQC